MPHLRDPHFSRSVVLLWEHTQEGALGCILNKPIVASGLKGVIANLSEEWDLSEMIEEAYFGGPVMVDRGVVLHGSGYKTEGTLRISEECAVTGSGKILKDIALGKGPVPFRLLLGHAGWGAGQVDREIENGDWLLQSVPSRFVFTAPAEEMWSRAVASFGIDSSTVAGTGGQA